MCGENIGLVNKCRKTAGSPPRVRGKPSLRRSKSRRAGITPACAGKTIYRDFRHCANKDHPRVCGENATTRPTASQKQGSPPRVRGKRERDAGYGQDQGITPACAGKTATYLRSFLERWDHPRVCGENRRSFCPFQSSEGSPPRVRGKLGV